jgi:hypothetical protein
VHLLIDFENVRDLRLTSVPADCHVAIFVGRLQKSIPLELTMDAQRLGARLEWIKIEGDGRNNLDFHIAFYLGRFSVQHRDAELVVLSKDKGFDALLTYRRQGLEVQKKISIRGTTAERKGAISRQCEPRNRYRRSL